MISPALFERIEKIKRWQRVAIFLGTIAVMAALFFYVFYLPLGQRVSDLEGEIEILTTRIAQSRIKARDIERLGREWREADARFKEALRILPDSREIPDLLRTITRKGEESRLEFLLFSPQKEVQKDFFIEIPVSIEVKGRYHDVVNFFSKVGGMQRIVNVLNVSMRPEKPLSTTLITRCTAVTYRFRGQSSEEDGSKTE